MRLISRRATTVAAAGIPWKAKLNMDTALNSTGGDCITSTTKKVRKRLEVNQPSNGMMLDWKLEAQETHHIRLYHHRIC